MIDFVTLSRQCAPEIHSDTMRRIVKVESSFNPYAIGVVGGHLTRQPRKLTEAVATARWLDTNGYNYSLGLAQVNKKNFAAHNITISTAFDPCRNLQAGGAILSDCYRRASQSNSDGQTALRDAFSCYYTGSFTSGHKLGYVSKVLNADGGRTDETRINVASNEPPASGRSSRSYVPIVFSKASSEGHSSGGGEGAPPVDQTFIADKVSPPRSALLF